MPYHCHQHHGKTSRRQTYYFLPSKQPQLFELTHLILTPSPTNLTTPTPPPGFSISIKFNETHPLKPAAVYINAIELMYKLAQYSWDVPIIDQLEYSDRRYDVLILSSPEQGPSPVKQPSQLQNCHVIIALYEVLLTMAARAIFCELFVDLLVNEKQVGNMNIFQWGGFDGDGHADDILTLTTSNSTEYISVLNGESGEIVDPDNNNFKISYAFYGQHINSQEIFTATLDGLATAAEFNRESKCDVIYATSVLKTCAFSITKNIGLQASQLSYAQVTAALRLLTVGVMLERKMFGEMEFALEFGGIQVGEGNVLRVSSASNATEGIAEAR